MNTSSTGSTPWEDIAPGINEVSQLYSYDFTCVRDTNVSWSDITNEIDNSRPCLLSAYPYPSTSSTHSVTVRAYNDSSYEIGLHNTWDNFTNWITFGDWSYAELVTVTP